MQEALGTNRIDREGCAQLSFSDLDSDRRLHSSAGTSFAATRGILARRTPVREPVFLLGLRARPCATDVYRGPRFPSMTNELSVRLSSAVLKRSDRRINVRSSSLSIASERWIIRASPDGLQ